MSCVLAGNGGPRSITGGMDSEGYNTYEVTHRVKCDVTDSVANVMNCPGLPVPGAFYAFMADIDVTAWCRFDKKVTMVRNRDTGPCRFYDVAQTFSNKPLSSDKQRCNDTPPGEPLLEPAKVSGSFVRYTEEATLDRFGNKIETSSHEQIRGPQVEFDANRPTVRIEQNVADLQLPLLAEFMRDGGMLNDAELWGVQPRGVRLSQVSWTKNYYGSCYVYYTRTLDFEVNIKKLEGMVGATAAVTINPGDNYNVGDIITIGGGDFAVPCVLMIASVGVGIGSGSITQAGDVIILNGGQYRTPPSNPVTGSTNGLGVGATFALTFGEVVVSGWDRDLLDEGTKVLNGYWHRDGTWHDMAVDEFGDIPADPSDPSHFIVYRDRNGNPTRVILNGHGVPIDVGHHTSGTADDYPGNIHVEKYPQDDLTLLGIPLVL